MAKQTMGTPCQALTHRCDTKMYRLQNPQTPIARTKLYRKYHMDEYPNGTNAVVAVLAYTGVGGQGGQGLGFIVEDTWGRVRRGIQVGGCGAERLAHCLVCKSWFCKVSVLNLLTHRL